ncbi:MAG: hypothetical protein IKW30_04455 [Lachnospiraceae bacterium]|nr:hypothetical protein [Lachnospiraceae bacterium]
MKEITARELATAFNGVLAEINTTDYYGITFEMSKARIEFSEEDGELSFTTGNYNYDGVGAVVVKEDLIDTIEHDEESDQYLISFTSDIPDIVVSRFKDLEELEKEHAERKQQ